MILLTIHVALLEEYSLGSCYFVSPSGSIEYHLDNGQVVDGDGALVDDVDVWDDGGDSSVCGIRIQEMKDIHDEENDLHSAPWLIVFTISGGSGLFGQELLNTVGVGIHLRDENLLPLQLQDRLGFKPVHYDISIIPDLTMDNQTISFTGGAKVTENISILAYCHNPNSAQLKV